MCVTIQLKFCTYEIEKSKWHVYNFNTHLHNYCEMHVWKLKYIYFKNILSVPSGGGTGLSMLSFSWKEAEINQGIIINFKSYFW